MNASLPFGSYGWLRSPRFDLTLVVGAAGLALFCGWLVTSDPHNFYQLIFFLNLWFLGYHHVVSTFTRLTFDKESFQDNKFLITKLPFIVILGVMALLMLFGAWAVSTLYFYWQWFHYTRQSYGLGRIYERKLESWSEMDEWLTKAIIYVIPLWGILNRSYQAPSHFLGLEIKVLPVTLEIVQFLGVVSGILIGLWVLRQGVAIAKKQFQLGYSAYMVSHIAIFYVGYILIDHINPGWLVLNIWHNAQYVLIVWMYNNNRFKNGIDPQHKFLSKISQKESLLTYFLICIAISTVAYFSLQQATQVFTTSVMTSAVGILIYQTINFHHYVVDGIIWKVRKKKVRENFGLK